MFILVIIIGVCSALVYRLFIVGSIAANHLQATSTTAMAARTPVLSLPLATPTATGGVCHVKQRAVELGIAFPQWSPTGYNNSDNQWLSEVPQMRMQTSACWIEMPILFNQANLHSTVVTTGQSTPSLASVRAGVQFAHEQGLHVFLTFLLQPGGSHPWAGAIQFTSETQEQAWFHSYWLTIQPYVQVAQQTGVEQLALGTEEEWLQENAPARLWDTLIANIHNEFSGALTYDINWTSLSLKIPAWLHNSALKMIGVSAYIPLITHAQRVDPQQIAALWATTVKRQLDAFAIQLGEPIFISEIGYRNSSDALYQPWLTQSSAPADPQEQAAACSAVLTNVLNDPQILGSFFWGWDNVEEFNLKSSPAAAAIQTHYRSFQA